MRTSMQVNACELLKYVLYCCCRWRGVKYLIQWAEQLHIRTLMFLEVGSFNWNVPPNLNFLLRKTEDPHTHKFEFQKWLPHV